MREKSPTVLVEPSVDKESCISMYRALTNKDQLPRACKDFLHYRPDEVLENHSLNVKGGYRPKNGVSHAALQRRLTGKMSGISHIA